MLNALLKHLKEQKDINLTNEILIDVFSNSILPLKYKEPEVFKQIIHSLYVECYGEHFSDWLAIQAVSEMKNVDGSEGEHWSISQIEDAIRQYNIKGLAFNKWDIYYVMNMLYSDYSNVFGSDTSTYAKVCKAWFEDIDVAEGKAYRYYMNVAKPK